MTSITETYQKSINDVYKINNKNLKKLLDSDIKKTNVRYDNNTEILLYTFIYKFFDDFYYNYHVWNNNMTETYEPNKRYIYDILKNNNDVIFTKIIYAAHLINKGNKFELLCNDIYDIIIKIFDFSVYGTWLIHKNKHIIDAMMRLYGETYKNYSYDLIKKQILLFHDYGIRLEQVLSQLPANIVRFTSKCEYILISNSALKKTNGCIFKYKCKNVKHSLFDGLVCKKIEIFYENDAQLKATVEHRNGEIRNFLISYNKIYIPLYKDIEYDTENDVYWVSDFIKKHDIPKFRQFYCDIVIYT